MASMSKAAQNALAAERAEKEEAIKKRAARQAAARLSAPAEPEAVVECTVLPMGADKISMGEHVPPYGEAHYEEGETFNVALPIAVALFDRGFVNFPGGSEASKTSRAARSKELMAERIAAEELRAILEND